MVSKILENIVNYYRKDNLIVNENSFNPTPKLKSSPVPILFIPFNTSDKICNFCENEYSETDFFYQKFCKNCLSKYLEDDNVSVRNIKYNTCLLKNFNYSDDVIYLDAHIEYENTGIKCVKYFKRVTMLSGGYFEPCSCCYKIFSGWVGSTSPISILHLPWWDISNNCVVCNQALEFKTDYQKWCSYCIIIYTGCRHCLTTNIIFGVTGESQCKKCKRISLITITIKMIKIKKKYLKINTNSYKQISNYTNNTGKISDPLKLYEFIKKLNLFPLNPFICWSSYSQITSLLGNNVNSFKPNLPIMFIPFNNEEDKCHYCGKKYSITYLFEQKYCSFCLYLHIKFTENTKYTIKDMYACDIYIQKSQKWSEISTTILFFDKIFTNNNSFYVDGKIIDNRKDCKLCGKLIYEQTSIDSKYKLCSNCYKISFEYEFDYHSTKPKIKWVSYSQINILKKIAEGGFGIIYKALINGDVVVIKKILNSQEPNKYFLNELKSLYQCYDNKFECIIKCHGITKDPITKELMFIMKYANGGDLHNYLQENFAEITWKKKLHI
ncbi:hypothetical protein RhiirB3_444440, partial [Rhizophagus irregularis]